MVLALVLVRLQRTPWGRVLRAIRGDEDATRALGKNTLAYKLQSLAIAAAVGSAAGYLLALNLSFLTTPESFEPLFTLIGYAVLVLGGLEPLGSRRGSDDPVAHPRATRFVDLPLPAEKVAALRLVIVGVVLILLMAFRPQGMFGKHREMVLGD